MTGGRQRVRVHFQFDGVFLPVGVDDDVGRLDLNGGRDRHLKQVLRVADLYLPVLLLLHWVLDVVVVPVHVHVLELVVVMVMVVVLQVHMVGHGQCVPHHVAGLLECQQRLVLVVRGRRPGLGLVVILVEHHRLVERALVHGVVAGDDVG